MIYCSKSLFYGFGLRCLAIALLRISLMLSDAFYEFSGPETVRLLILGP